MRELSNITRSNSDSETSREDGDIAESFTGNFDKNLNIFKRANSVPITKIFSYYGVRLDINNRKTFCPFPHHKNGRENTPSFWYYPETNTYCCFGCREGSTPSDFVSNMNRISKLSAAYKILEIFSNEDIEVEELEIHNSSERLEIMLDFSNTVREFRQNYISEKDFEFIEEICKIYDNINLKFQKQQKPLSNEALLKVVIALKERITSYKSCLML